MAVRAGVASYIRHRIFRALCAWSAWRTRTAKSLVTDQGAILGWRLVNSISFRALGTRARSPWRYTVIQSLGLVLSRCACSTDTPGARLKASIALAVRLVITTKARVRVRRTCLTGAQGLAVSYLSREILVSPRWTCSASDYIRVRIRRSVVALITQTIHLRGRACG